jgi:hypothetical protein
VNFESDKKPFVDGYIKVKDGVLDRLLSEGYGIFEGRVINSDHDRYLIDSDGLIRPIHRDNAYAHGNATEFVLTKSGFEWVSRGGRNAD